MCSSAKPLGTPIDSISNSEHTVTVSRAMRAVGDSLSLSKEAIVSLILTLLVIDVLVQWIFHTLGMLGRCAESAFTS